METEDLKNRIVEGLTIMLDAGLFEDYMYNYGHDYTDDNLDPKLQFRMTGNDPIAVKNRKLYEYMRDFRVSSLPASVRDHLQSLNIAETYKTYKEFDPYNIQDDIFENRITDKYPFLKFKATIDPDCYIESGKSVVDYLVNKYGLKYDTFKSYAPNKEDIINMTLVYNCSRVPFGTTMAIRVSDIVNKHNLEDLDIIDQECADRGYFRAMTWFDYDDRGYYVKCIYNPVRDMTVRESIEDIQIYHSTYTDNHDSILDYGLLPNNNHRVYDYLVDKLFFYIGGSPKDKNYVKMMTGIVKTQRNKRFNTEMYVYSLKPGILPDNIEFFYDPNLYNCVYCTVPIPSRYLTIEYIVDFLNLEKDGFKRIKEQL